MPPKRKSEGTTIADEGANTPSKRIRNAAPKAMASDKAASLVSASCRGLIVTIQPTRQSTPRSTGVADLLLSYSSMVRPRLVRRESGVAHARHRRNRPLRHPMNLSADEDVLGRFSPKQILRRQLQLELRRLRREVVAAPARSQVCDALENTNGNLLIAHFSCTLGTTTTTPSTTPKKKDGRGRPRKEPGRLHPRADAG